VSFDLDTKEQIKRAVDIVDLFAASFELRREGRIFKCLCPWHDDHKPSLQINPDRQTYKCWVCGEGGDIFSFVMKHENVGFAEAITLLAERAGIEIKRQGRPSTPGSADPKAPLLKAMAWAVDEYHRALVDSSEGEMARRYLDDRGITHESIEKFKLGYAPDNWEWLLPRAAKQQISVEGLERSGLCARRQSGNGMYDRFKGRVLFPIRDQQNRPVALGGRVLPRPEPEVVDDNAKQMAKYINSPETPLFSKSQMLYGLEIAGPAIRQVGTVIVMEGYTDCIVAHQMGVGNAVAVLGTALTERHLPVLKRMGDRIRIVLVLDGDEAGRRRSNDILELFLAQQIDLRILTLPDNLDPCDFLLERGADAFRGLIEQAPDALEHKFITTTSELGGSRDTFSQTEAVEELLNAMALSPRLREGTSSFMRLKEEQILNRMSLRFNISEQTLRNRMTELRNGRRPERAQRRDEQSAPHAELPTVGAPWERELLEIVITCPDLFDEIAARIGPDQLSQGLLREVYQKCLDLREADLERSLDRLMLEFDEPYTKRLLVELDEKGTASQLTPKARLDNLLVRVTRIEETQQSRQARETVRAQPDAPEADRTLTEVLARRRNYSRVAAFRDELLAKKAAAAEAAAGGLRQADDSDQNEVT